MYYLLYVCFYWSKYKDLVINLKKILVGSHDTSNSM